MDPYTIGILLKSLLASAGLKATLAIVAVGGSIFGVMRGLRFVASFMERMQSSRDALMSETMRRISEQDSVNAAYRVELAKVLERINGHQESALAETKDIRVEMHQRFNKIQEDVTTIKGAVS